MGIDAIGRSRTAWLSMMVPRRPDEQGLVRVLPAALRRGRDGVVQGDGESGRVVVLDQALDREAHVEDVHTVSGSQCGPELTSLSFVEGTQFLDRGGIVETTGTRPQRDREHLQVGAPGDAVKIKLHQFRGDRSSFALGNDQACDRRAVTGSRAVFVTGSGQETLGDPAAIEFPVVPVDAGVDHPHRHPGARRHEGALLVHEPGIGLRRMDVAQPPVPAPPHSVLLRLRGAVLRMALEILVRGQSRRLRRRTGRWSRGRGWSRVRDRARSGHRRGVGRGGGSRLGCRCRPVPPPPPPQPASSSPPARQSRGSQRAARASGCLVVRSGVIAAPSFFAAILAYVPARASRLRRAAAGPFLVRRGIRIGPPGSVGTARARAARGRFPE